jgi:hypothetical protein
MNSVVSARAGRLAGVLLDEGLRTGDRVDILCCDDHAVDRAVALAACALVDVDGVVIEPELWAFELAALVRWSGARLALACDHGSAAWLAAGCVGRLLGDGPLLPWWGAAEARARVTAPAAGVRRCRTGSAGVVRRSGASWVIEPIDAPA